MDNDAGSCRCQNECCKCSALEYQSLRSEILQNDKLCQFLSVAGLLLLTASFGVYLWSGGLVELLYFPPLIYFAWLQLMLHKYEGTVRIASYLATFIEPGCDCLGWETRLATLRDLAPAESSLGRFFGRLFRIEVLLLFITTLGTLRLALLDLLGWTQILPILACLLLVFAASLYQIYRLSSKADPGGGFEAQWRLLKERESRD
jgi:hypothetical protein